MRELIYKDEAYKAIDNCICDSWYRISPADAKMNISCLVSDANRPRGKWLIEKTLYDNYNYKCSCCNWYECHAYPDVEPYNFCPNCGTDMRNKNDE